MSHLENMTLRKATYKAWYKTSIIKAKQYGRDGVEGMMRVGYATTDLLCTAAVDDSSREGPSKGLMGCNVP